MSVFDKHLQKLQENVQLEALLSEDVSLEERIRLAIDLLLKNSYVVTTEAEFAPLRKFDEIKKERDNLKQQILSQKKSTLYSGPIMAATSNFSSSTAGGTASSTYVPLNQTKEYAIRREFMDYEWLNKDEKIVHVQRGCAEDLLVELIKDKAIQFYSFQNDSKGSMTVVAKIKVINND